MEVSGRINVPAFLPPKKSPGAHLSRSGRFGIGKNLLHLPGIEPGPSSYWSFAVLTEVSRLMRLNGVVLFKHKDSFNLLHYSWWQ
jgi:hypothetical protein